MALVNIDFDVTEYENVQTDFTPLPDGEYIVCAKETSIGEYNGFTQIKIKFEVVQGRYQGRFIFDDIVIVGGDGSENAQTRLNIGRGKLLGILTATNLVNRFGETDLLLGIPVTVKVKTTTASNGKTYTNVNAYSPANAEPAMQQPVQQAQPQQQPVQQQQGGGMMWGQQ